MLPILLGIAAIALLSGCSRSNSDNPPPPAANPPANPEDPHAHCHPSGSGMAATPASASGNYPYHRSLQFADARSEYVDLCEVLFNTRNTADCDAMQASAAATQAPSADAGLNAYYRGISRGLDGYSFSFADRDARWSNRLHRLQGAPLYLAGHGGCPADNPRASTCLKLNGGTEIPAEFNFMDDYYNLLGTFFFLQANRDAIGNGAHCTIVAATLGSEDRPFCHAFAMHNLVLTPISNRLRGVDPTVHLSRLRGVETSECH